MAEMAEMAEMANVAHCILAARRMNQLQGECSRLVG